MTPKVTRTAPASKRVSAFRLVMAAVQAKKFRASWAPSCIWMMMETHFFYSNGDVGATAS